MKIQKKQEEPPTFLLRESVWIDIATAITRGHSKTGLLGLLTKVSDSTKTIRPRRVQGQVGAIGDAKHRCAWQNREVAGIITEGYTGRIE